MPEVRQCRKYPGRTSTPTPPPLPQPAELATPACKHACAMPQVARKLTAASKRSAALCISAQAVCRPGCAFPLALVQAQASGTTQSTAASVCALSLAKTDPAHQTHALPPQTCVTGGMCRYSKALLILSCSRSQAWLVPIRRKKCTRSHAAKGGSLAQPPSEGHQKRRSVPLSSLADVGSSGHLVLGATTS
jgi:hypothetical protein